MPPLDQASGLPRLLALAVLYHDATKTSRWNDLRPPFPSRPVQHPIQLRRRLVVITISGSASSILRRRGLLELFPFKLILPTPFPSTLLLLTPPLPPVA